jgi:hypothetical protein
MADKREPVLLAVTTSDGVVHAVGLIFPEGHSQAACGALAGTEEKRVSNTPLSALTCPVCRAWAEGG